MNTTTVEMKWQLRIGGLFVLIAAIPLFFFTSQTDAYFAWTVKPPLLSAAFLGAGYLSSALLGIAAAERSLWAHARIAVPGSFAFTVLTFLATLLHLDKFHFSAPNLMTVLITWAWLLAYGGVPVSMAVVWARQLKVAGENPRPHPLPAWLRMASLFPGMLLILAGALLFLAPQTSASWWVWSLTPLVARAVASWLIAVGIIAVQIFWENDRVTVQPAFIFFALYGIFQGIALARYADDFAWGALTGWAYLAMLGYLFLLGAAGWMSVRSNKPEDGVAGG